MFRHKWNKYIYLLFLITSLFLSSFTEINVNDALMLYFVESPILRMFANIPILYSFPRFLSKYYSLS